VAVAHVFDTVARIARFKTGSSTRRYAIRKSSYSAGLSDTKSSLAYKEQRSKNTLHSHDNPIKDTIESVVDPR